MCAEAAGERANSLDRFASALGDDIGRAELARKRQPILVTAEDDDLLRTQPPGGDHAAKADGSVSHHGDALAGADLGDDCGVMTGSQYV
jgi:hypothetical protein